MNESCPAKVQQVTNPGLNENDNQYFWGDTTGFKPVVSPHQNLKMQKVVYNRRQTQSSDQIPHIYEIYQVKLLSIFIK